jgi:hypothetical protein
VFIDNEGNGNDEIRIEITNKQDLLDAGIQALFTEDRVDVAYNETAEVGLYIKVDRYTAHQSYEIEIKGRSAQAEGLGEISQVETLTIFLDVVIEKSYVEPEPEPEPEPDDDDTEPEPEPEPDDDNTEPEPEPEMMPDDETVDDDETLEELEQTDARGDKGSSILIPLVVIGIVMLFVIVPGALYLLIRRSGNKGVKVEVIE